MSKPRLSRYPSRLTAVAWTTQAFTMRPPSCTFTTSASSIRNGYGDASRGRARNDFTSSSSSPTSRETWLLEIGLHLELLDGLLHAPRRDAGQIEIGDRADQRLLRPAPPLQEPVGEVEPSRSSGVSTPSS
jgi:hypothetical protein